MTLPYIRLEYNETVDARRNMLSSEINVLNSAKQILAYKKLRKTEMIARSNLKSLVKQTNAKINLLLKELPATNQNAPKIESKLEKTKKRSIEQELAEIHSKLSRI